MYVFRTLLTTLHKICMYLTKNWKIVAIFEQMIDFNQLYAHHRL